MDITTEPVISYISDGLTVSYDFPFVYLREAFVGVRVNADAYEDFTVEGQTVTLKEAPKKGAKIKIYRNTSTERLTNWNDGSVLKAKDLNLQHVQVIHILEELYEANKEWTEENVRKVINQLIDEKVVATPEEAQRLINESLKAYFTAEEIQEILQDYPTNEALAVALESYVTSGQLSEALASLSGLVKSVNGVKPDDSGNVEIQTGTESYTKAEIDQKLKEITDILNSFTDADSVSY